MVPFISLHPGEVFVGNFIESNFKRLNLWIPAKDSGVDLLVTSISNNSSISIQVKSSRDYNMMVDSGIKSGSFFNVRRNNLISSPAKLWIFVQHSARSKGWCQDYIVFERDELVVQLEEVFGSPEQYTIYFSITGDGRVWITRGVPRKSLANMYGGDPAYRNREVLGKLNNWEALKSLQSTDL